MSKPPCTSRPECPAEPAQPGVKSSKSRRPKRDISTLIVTDDWPEEVPISEAEIRVFERYFGDVFDELFGTIEPVKSSKR